MLIRHDTVIDAPIEACWEVLSDIAGFEPWNPLLRRIDGELGVGNDLVLYVDLPSGETAIPVTGSRLLPGIEFGWTFFERAPVLYRGEHVYRLESVDGGTTRLIDREYFWGLLLPLRRRELQQRIPAAMAAMGRALAERIEARPRPH